MSTILDEVMGVLNEREANYDHPLPNFSRIADYWSVLFRDQVNELILRIEGCRTLVEVLAIVKDFEFRVTPEQVSMAMMLMKIAREQHQHKRDNLLDIVGYVVCQEKIVDAQSQDQEKADERRKDSATYQYTAAGIALLGGSRVSEQSVGRVDASADPVSDGGRVAGSKVWAQTK